MGFEYSYTHHLTCQSGSYPYLFPLTLHPKPINFKSSGAWEGCNLFNKPTVATVSYTHLDVYKRQIYHRYVFYTVVGWPARRAEPFGPALSRTCSGIRSFVSRQKKNRKNIPLTSKLDLCFAHSATPFS